MNPVHKVRNVIFAISLLVLMFVILYKDITLIDGETKNKFWFKSYVTYMKIQIGITIIFLFSELFSV